MAAQGKTTKKAPASAPYGPPRWTKADAGALQALQRGDADPHQQQRAIRWIVEAAAATYDLAYRPGGEEGRRDTDFALGRAFVGQQIVKLTKIDLQQVKDEDQT